MLDVSLERVDGPGSPWAYPNVDLIVGRRCGKTITLMGVPLYRALRGPVTLDTGKVVPFGGAHTAQNLVKARQRFMKDLVEPFQESMSPAVWRAGVNLRSAIGDTVLTIDPATSGKDWRKSRASTMAVFAPTKSSVRGDGLFHIGLDEILVFTAQQGEELLAAAGPTLGTLRGHGQIWRASNVSKLNDSKTWLYQVREKGRAAVESGRNTGTAYFEFTIPEDADVTDERLWPLWYPGIADGLVRVEELREDLERLGIENFAAEYFGRWPDEVRISAWAAIARADWEATGTALEQPDDAKVAIGVDIDPFGRSSTITAAVDDPEQDGTLVEAIAHQQGSVWVAGRVRELAASVASIAIDDYGPGHDLILALREDPVVAEKILPLGSSDFAAACYVFDAGIRERRMRHRHDEVVDQAAAAAERTTGKAWQWERRVAVSQTPIVSATLAAWALGRAPDPGEFFVY